MEVVGELVNVEIESKAVNELKGELAEDVEVQGSEKTTLLLEKKHLESKEGADDREPEVTPFPILERKAEEIIPKECWEAVFRNLNAEDLLSCRKVCKTFHQLLDLKEFNTKWRFHLVLPHLLPYLQARNVKGRAWKSLYSVRLTCLSWRLSVDKYLSEGLEPVFFREFQPLATCFKSLEDLDEFQDEFGEYNTNPFPLRSVDIQSPDDDEFDEDMKVEYIKKVGDFLEQFGRDIAKLCLYFTTDFSFALDPLSLCKLIKKATIHLPNMRKFIINNFNPDEEYKGHDDNEEVVNFIEENVLAALPKLEALSIYGLDKAVEDYLLEKYASQLTHFERGYTTHHLNPVHMQKLKNTRKMKLDLADTDDSLEVLEFLESPLKFLKLTRDRTSTFRLPWNMDKVFRNLKHLPIEYLKISFRVLRQVNVTESGIDTKEYINESIQTLRIHIKFYDNRYTATVGQISFNFLQAMRKLEKLELRISGDQVQTTHPKELAEVVKLNEYLMETEWPMLYHSNLWEKVPSLKTLIMIRRPGQGQVTSTTYTREKYEMLMMNAE